MTKRLLKGTKSRRRLPADPWSQRMMASIELDPGLSWTDYPCFSIGLMHLLTPSQWPEALQKSHWRWLRTEHRVIVPYSHARPLVHVYLHAQLFGPSQSQLRRCPTCTARNCVNPFHWTPSGTASESLSPREAAQPAPDAVPEPTDEALLRETIERQVLQLGNRSITALAQMLEGLFTREDIERLINSDPLLKKETTE